MAKTRTRARLTRTEAADRLTSLAQQLRDGSISLAGGPKLPVAEQVEEQIELKAELRKDELEVELKWRPAAS